MPLDRKAHAPGLPKGRSLVRSNWAVRKNNHRLSITKLVLGVRPPS